MSSKIVFRHFRLLVGSRARDWSDVWYEPVLTVDEGSERKRDGTYNMQLASKSTGRDEAHDPQPEEVIWDKHFDPANCEAKGIKAKEKMQREILYNAWRYCRATDEYEIQQLEQELDAPDFIRWQAWFRHAIKWKRSQLKSRSYRRQARSAQINAARQAGVPEEDINDSLLESSDDSAYEDDGERARVRKKRRTNDSMAPPPTPRPASGRQRNERGAGPPGPKSKPKPRPKPGGNAPGGMSGLASRSNSGSSSSGRPIVIDTDDEDEDDDDDDDDDHDDDDSMSRPWDSRPPEGPSSSGAAPVNYFDGREYMMEKDPTAAGAPRRTSASDLAKRLGGRKPCHMPTPTATENSAPPRREGSVFRAEDLSNNGLSYEKAIDAGLRISMQPDEHDVGLKQAIAASLEPESHGGRDGEDGGDNGEGNGRDSGVGDE